MLEVAKILREILIGFDDAHRALRESIDEPQPAIFPRVIVAPIVPNNLCPYDPVRMRQSGERRLLSCSPGLPRATATLQVVNGYDQ